MRFTVKLYGAYVFGAATYDELYAKIAQCHSSRQKACGFAVTRKLNAGYDSYEITDNHEEHA